jgi:hypothetical protein
VNSFPYKVAPQGARCSVVIFAHIISERFTHLLHQKKVIVCQDDMLYHDCASFACHYDSQQNIYDVARENTFLFKAIKTHLNYRKQKVLGHIVSKQGRTVNPGLVRDIIALRKLMKKMFNQTNCEMAFISVFLNPSHTRANHSAYMS